MSIKSFLLYNCNLIHLRYRQKELQQLLPLYQKKGENTNYTNTIIYMCDGRIKAGGLCDRLRGFISLYLLCKERGLAFKANFCEPFQLHKYLEPNAYDWFIDNNCILYNRTAAKPVLIACSYRSNGGTLTQELACQIRYLNKVIINNPNKELHVYTNMHYAYYCEVQ